MMNWFFILLFSAGMMVSKKATATTHGAALSAEKKESSVVGYNIKGLFGLEEIPFDDLNKILSGKAKFIMHQGVAKNWVPIVKKYLLETEEGEKLLRTTNKVEIFESITNYIAEQALQAEEDFYRLAREIADFREAYRLQSPLAPVINSPETSGDQRITSLKLQREILFLLQMIQEEILYVGYVGLNPEGDLTPTTKSWLWTAESQRGIRNSSEQSFSGALPLRGFQVRNGDVLLSKATGSGSSSFIALTGDAPHIFSHSALAVITEFNGFPALVSPEADIADGVKLRMLDDYREGAKTRLAIYRLAHLNTNDEALIKASTDNFLRKILERSSDPFHNPAFRYDFELRPDSENAYYCAAIPCRIYKEIPWADERNPYPRMSWGQPSEVRRIVYDFLEIPRLPSAAPGDLETNSNYELIGFEILLHQLELERIELAMIDSLFDLLTENRASLERLVAHTDRLGDEPITPAQVEFLVNRGLISKEKAMKIPRHIKPKQMIFFGYLNEIFTPKIREIMLKEVQEQRNAGQWMGLQALRKLAYSIQSHYLKETKREVKNFLGILGEAQRMGRNERRSCLMSLRKKDLPVGLL